MFSLEAAAVATSGPDTPLSTVLLLLTVLDILEALVHLALLDTLWLERVPKVLTVSLL